LHKLSIKKLDSKNIAEKFPESCFL